MTPVRRSPPEGYTDLQHAIAAYQVLMERVIVPESQYKLGAEDVERELHLGSIVERAAARRREAEREAERKGRDRAGAAPSEG